jgi:hypothetical protein
MDRRRLQRPHSLNLTCSPVALIPQNKDIPEKETPPMQLAPGRGGNWGASGLSGMLCYRPSDDGTPAPMLKNLKGIGPWPTDDAGDET